MAVNVTAPTEHEKVCKFVSAASLHRPPMVNFKPPVGAATDAPAPLAPPGIAVKSFAPYPLPVP